MTRFTYLDDAEEIQKEAKYTFYRPSQELITKLRIGNYVKLIFRLECDNDDTPNAERMWVEIAKIRNGLFEGRLDNDPVFIEDLKCGDLVKFESKHIINTNLEIEEPEDIVEKYLSRCLITNKVLYEKQKITYLYREESLGKLDNGFSDSGWRILEGSETQEYLDDSENSSFVSLGAVLNIDDSIINLLEQPIGSEFEWNSKKENFEKV